VVGLYLPPLFNHTEPDRPPPPQTIISLPVQTAVCCTRATGAPLVVVVTQVSVQGAARQKRVAQKPKVTTDNTAINVVESEVGLLFTRRAIIQEA